MQELNYREISLSDWTPSGAGATATSYNHKENQELMLKLFNVGISNSGYAEKEFDLSRKVEALGLRTPRAIEIVKAGKCTGVIYQRIVRKKSTSRSCADNPEDIDKYARIFAEECKNLHSISCSPSDFSSRKAQALKDVAEHKGYSRHTKEVIAAAINRLGDHTTCLHGDMQPGNLLIADGSTYWIDLGFFSWGHPMFDIACLYFFCKHPIGLFWGTKLCHLTRRQMKHFWESFASAYSNNPEELTSTAKDNVLVYLAYTIGLENYEGITAAVFDAYINAICLRR